MQVFRDNNLKRQKFVSVW